MRIDECGDRRVHTAGAENNSGRHAGVAARKEEDFDVKERVEERNGAL